MEARVGKPAPEFDTKAFMQGEIRDVKLSDYRGHWVLLYFYPGDFTFV
jgi:alkyl hydroperoxide reductase subunit AhpC